MRTEQRTMTNKKFRVFLAMLMAVSLAGVASLASAQTVVKKDTKPAAAATGLERLPSPGDVSLSFANLKDGDEVEKSFRVKFVITGMRVKPAGEMVENSGHHHLLIDVDDDDLPDFNLPLPMNESVYHFGKGEKSAVITMPPGEHTLQLLFADYRHIPHDPPVMSEKITVTVIGEDSTE